MFPIGGINHILQGRLCGAISCRSYNLDSHRAALLSSHDYQNSSFPRRVWLRDAHVTNQDAQVPLWDARVPNQDLRVTNQDLYVTNQDLHVTNQDAGVPNQDAPVLAQDVCVPKHDAGPLL